MGNAGLQAVSERVAARFVHTVVLVDDKAFAPAAPPPVKATLAPPGRATEPVSPVAASAVPAAVAAPSGSGTGTGAPAASDPGAAGREPDELDAPTLIKTFAKAGLVCAVIAPSLGEDVVEEVAVAARRSDVLVLDWVVHGKDGDDACKIIERVLKDDRKENGRLRLIAIYTGDKGLREVINKVDATIRPILSDLVKGPEGVDLQAASTRVVVLAKAGTGLAPGELQLASQLVSLGELPARLHKEFARVTAGLVSNVAVHSLAVLRENTHSLIANLGSTLDAAFLAHRVLLPEPSEAEEHAVDIVADEIGSILHAHEVGEVSDLDASEKFAAATGIDVVDWLKKMDVVSPSATTLAGLLKSGTSAMPKIPKPVNRLDKITQLFVSDPVAARASEVGLAEASMLVRRYGTDARLPRLTLGTVIVRADPATTRNKYLVCVLPRCDCVRLRPEGRTFVFLAAVVDAANFNLIVRDAGTPVRLRVEEKTENIETVTFAPSAGASVVVAREDGTELVFTSTGGVIERFRWLAQLKPTHAQRVANRVAADLASVGLNEPEWLRLRAKKQPE